VPKVYLKERNSFPIVMLMDEAKDTEGLSTPALVDGRGIAVNKPQCSRVTSAGGLGWEDSAKWSPLPFFGFSYLSFLLFFYLTEFSLTCEETIYQIDPAIWVGVDPVFSFDTLMGEPVYHASTPHTYGQYFLSRLNLVPSIEGVFCIHNELRE